MRVPAPPLFSGTAHVLTQVRDVQGALHEAELEGAVDLEAPAIGALDDRLELSIGSVKYEGDEGEFYVESADDPERAEGYAKGDKVDLAHIRLKRSDAPDQLKPGYAHIPSELDLATWIVRKPGQSALAFVRDAIAKARQFLADCQPFLDGET